ncbi:MAG: glutamate--tRNA ligase [bacterium]
MIGNRPGSDIVRVRFAPSPTGHLHIGNVRTALYNYLFARHTGGAFILRIEDTDITRSEALYVDTIMSDLHWVGIEWDEGPRIGEPIDAASDFFQSSRFAIYRAKMLELIQSGEAFPCFCLPGEADRIDWKCRNLTIAEMTRKSEAGEKAVIRFRVPETEKVAFDDLLRGRIEIEAKEIGDFSIYKPHAKDLLNQWHDKGTQIMQSESRPLYNFSVVIDDHDMHITQVIRGEDHLTNTPKQILLYRAFGWAPPLFMHLPLIVGSDNAPLSKRHGATAIDEFEAQGYLPDALFNYLALLGWAPGDDREIMSKEALVREFTLEKIHKAPAKFDIEKLKWMNGKYLRALPDDALAEKLTVFLTRARLVQDGDVARVKPIIHLYRERIERLSDIVERADFHFRDPHISADLREKYLNSPHLPETFRKVVIGLNKTPDFQKATVEPVLRQLAQGMNLKAKDLFQPMRVALTGKDQSPGLFEVMEALGRDAVIRRLEREIR